MGSEVSRSVLGLIENLSNIERVTTYYNFHLIKDEDDNKFVDCAIASNSRYTVTHDKDFKVLDKINFLKIKIIGIKDFQLDLQNYKQGQICFCKLD